MNHTPGPWKAARRDAQYGGYTIKPAIEPEGLCLAIIPKNGRPDAEVHDNASLIEAAPDIAAELSQLELELQSFIDCGTSPTDEWLRDNLESIRALLIKALGESNAGT